LIIGVLPMVSMNPSLIVMSGKPTRAREGA
jgi:hypothetical protein